MQFTTKFWNRNIGLVQLQRIYLHNRIKEMKFNIQDRIVLDEMVDTFTTEMIKQHEEYDLLDKKPIITKEYWLLMIKEVQNKIDNFTTVKALKHSKRFK